MIAPARACAIALIFLLIAPRPPCYAQATPFHAGIARPVIDAAQNFEALVWYPTETDEVAWQAGPFIVPATRNAKLAAGRFPIILLSHGGGLGGGTPLVLRYLSAALARAGFIVIAPFHQKTGLSGRPLQITRALEAVLADPRFAPHAEPARLGMLGFSLGTTVTLELAGAVPNVAHLVAYCAAHPGDAMSCDHAPDRGNAQPAGLSAPAPLPLKAIVLLDPFAVLFQRPELVSVTVPVLIFRATSNELPAAASVDPLTAALPRPPGVQAIPGSHFVYTDTCPAFLRSESPDVCRDPPGVDRDAVHAAIVRQIIGFFRKTI